MNEKEFIRWIRPFKDKMFRLAKRMLVSTEEAEDAVQETLMKLWVRKGSLSSYRKPEAMVMTMVKNYCLDRLKSKQAGHLSLVYVRERQAQDDPVRSTESREKMQLVRELIDRLPDKQKMIIHLRDIEEYDLDEIADIMQMSAVNVRVTLSRARKKIRELLLKKYHYGQV